MRYIKQGVVRDQAGNIFIGATISVYLAGTTTPASVYAAKTGGVAVNSVLTDTYGNFIYYVDTVDYSTSQLFKEVVTFSSKYDTQTVDDIIIFPVGGNGTVTSVSITSANGVSGTVANATTVPAITLTLGAITPTSVNSVVISGSSTPTLAVTGTTAVTGTNTGDETAARIATIVTGAGAQTTPLDADEFPFYKIVGTVLSKVTWANIKTTLGALFAPINNPTFTGTVIAGKVTITPVATGSTLTILDGKTVTANKTMSFTAADDTGVYTLPTGTKTIAATDSNITGTAANVSGTPALPNGTTATTQSAGGNDTKLATTAFVTTAVGAISGGTVATGAELDTGTDNAKFSSAKALKDSHNVPSVVPSTSGNVLTSNGTDWTSAAISSSGIPIAAGGGTVNAITATFSPTLTLANEPVVAVVSAGTNGITNPTFAADGGAAKTIYKYGGATLGIGDLPSAGGTMLFKYRSSGTTWELLNPRVFTTYSIGAGTTYTLASANTERTTAATAPAKKKEILILQPGTYTYSFDHKGTVGVTNYGQVYKNGSAYGTFYTITTPALDLYSTRSESLAFVVGDLIQVYIYTDAGGTAYVQNFNVKYAVTATFNTPFSGTVNTD